MIELVASAGTWTVTWLKLTALGVPAVTPPNFTVGVPPFKFKPVSVTFVPTFPLVGEKLKSVGGTVKVLLWTNPAGATSRIVPVTAFVGTMMLTALLLSTV
jgi:hypothetical protein